MVSPYDHPSFRGKLTLFFVTNMNLFFYQVFTHSIIISDCIPLWSHLQRIDSDRNAPKNTCGYQVFYLFIYLSSSQSKELLLGNFFLHTQPASACKVASRDNKILNKRIIYVLTRAVELVPKHPTLTPTLISCV